MGENLLLRGGPFSAGAARSGLSRRDSARPVWPRAEDEPVDAASAPEHTRVVVVCTGNVCRSAYAEHALATAIDGAGGLDGRVTVSSMGTQPNQALGVPRVLQRLGEEEGVRGLPAHRPRRLDAAELGRTHLILTATLEHMETVLAEAPQCLMRTFTILEFAALVDLLDVQEPDWLTPGMGVPAMARAAARHRSKVHAADGSLDLADPFNKAEDDYRQMVALLRPALATVRSAVERATAQPQ